MANLLKLLTYILSFWTLTSSKKRQTETEYLLSNLAAKTAFCGPFNSGKSYLINTIAECDILPVDGESESSIVVYLRPTTEVSYTLAHLPDGTTERKDINNYPITYLREYNHSNCRYVDVYLNNNKVKELYEKYHIILCDTPGTNSLNEDHEHIVYELLYSNDVLFVCLDAAKGSLDDQTIAAIKKAVLRNPDIQIGGVVTKSKKSEDIEKVKMYMQEVLLKSVASNCFLGVVSTNAKSGEISEISKLFEKINISLVLPKLQDKVIKLAKLALAEIDLKLSVLSMSEEEAQKKINVLKNNILSERKACQKKLTNFEQNIKKNINPLIVGYVLEEFNKHIDVFLTENTHEITQLYKNALKEGAEKHFYPEYEKFTADLTKSTPYIEDYLSISFSEDMFPKVAKRASAFLTLIAAIVITNPEPISKTISAILLGIATIITAIREILYYKTEEEKQKIRRGEAMSQINSEETKGSVLTQVEKMLSPFIDDIKEIITSASDSEISRLTELEEAITQNSKQKQEEIAKLEAVKINIQKLII